MTRFTGLPGRAKDGKVRRSIGCRALADSEMARPFSLVVGPQIQLAETTANSVLLDSAALSPLRSPARDCGFGCSQTWIGSHARRPVAVEASPCSLKAVSALDSLMLGYAL
jgi:hypothetical protein